jgi:hypothetical protein
MGHFLRGRRMYSPRLQELLGQPPRRPGGAGEPIVCSPVDALFTLAGSEIDCLVLEDLLIDRDMLPDSWPSLLPHWERRAPQTGGGIAEDLYTFV